MQTKFATLITLAMAASNALADPTGTFTIVAETPFGPQESILIMNADGSGSMEGMMGKVEFQNIDFDGDNYAFEYVAESPMGELDMSTSGSVDGDSIVGETISPMGPMPFTGSRN